MFAILGAEYVLRWLPIGTHDWDKFLTPKDLELITKKNNFLSDQLIGMKFNLFSKKWYESKDASVNYIYTFLKNQFSDLSTHGIVATSIPSSNNSDVSSRVAFPYIPWDVFLS